MAGFDRSSLQEGLRSPLKECSTYSGLGNTTATERSQILAIISEVEKHDSGVARALIQDLTHPENINQGMLATCTMTSLQEKLAIERPVDYARMIRNLAINGSHTFENDPAKSTVKVSLEEARANENPIEVKEPFSPRNITESLMQIALMRYSIGETVENRNPQLTYNAATDVTSGIYQNQRVSYEGRFEDQTARAHQGLFGKKVEVVGGGREGLDAIREKTSNHEKVLVQLNWGSEAGDKHAVHAVLVQKVENGQVEFYNPHGAKLPPQEKGAIQRMSVAEFEFRLSCAFIGTSIDNDGRVPEAPPFIAAEYEAVPDSEGTPVIQVQIKPLDPDKPVLVQQAKQDYPRITIVHEETARKSQNQEPDQREGAAERVERKVEKTRGTQLVDDDELRRLIAEQRRLAAES